MTAGLVGGIIEYGYRAEWRPLPVSITLVSGLALTAASLAFRLCAIRTLGRFYTSTVRMQDGQTVVQEGPYRIVRHPSYAGVLGTAYGISLSLASPLGALINTFLAIPAICAGMLARAPRARSSQDVMRLIDKAYAGGTFALDRTSSPRSEHPGNGAPGRRRDLRHDAPRARRVRVPIGRRPGCTAALRVSAVGPATPRARPLPRSRGGRKAPYGR